MRMRVALSLVLVISRMKVSRKMYSGKTMPIRICTRRTKKKEGRKEERKKEERRKKKKKEEEEKRRKERRRKKEEEEIGSQQEGHKKLEQKFCHKNHLLN